MVALPTSVSLSCRLLTPAVLFVRLRKRIHQEKKIEKKKIRVPCCRLRLCSAESAAPPAVRRERVPLLFVVLEEEEEGRTQLSHPD